MRRRGPTLPAVAACALAFAVVTGCGEPQDRAGTNTNWLRVCTSDAECGMGLACACGRCTRPCTAASDCEGLDGACAAAPAIALQCRAAAAPALCLRGCAADADCDAAQVCSGGTCVDPLPPADCAAASDLLACADFEGSLGDTTAVITEGNTAAASAERAVSGAGSLAAEVTLSTPSTAYVRADFAAQTAGVLYLRGWFQVPNAPAAYNLAPLGLWGSGEEEWALRLVVTQGATELWAYTTPILSFAALAPDTWHCVVLEVAVSDGPVAGTAGTSHVSVALDGASPVVVLDVDTLPTGGIDGLAIGTVWANEAASIRVDRVRLGTTPASCWD